MTTHLQYPLSNILRSSIETHRTLEYHLLLSLLEYNPAVDSISKNFPLLPLSETIGIARNKAVTHPTSLIRGKTMPCVIVTDLVVNFRTTKGIITVAYNIQSLGDLQGKSTVQMLDIQKEYWAERNVLLLVVTRDNFTQEQVKVITRLSMSRMVTSQNSRRVEIHRASLGTHVGTIQNLLRVMYLTTIG